MKIVLRRIKYWKYSRPQGTTLLAVTLLNPPLLSLLDEFQVHCYWCDRQQTPGLPVHTHTHKLTHTHTQTHTHNTFMYQCLSFTSYIFILYYYVPNHFIDYIISFTTLPLPLSVNLTQFFHWLSHFHFVL
jgi:hypothetical protein